MNEEMEKIAEYERNQREGLLEPNPVRNFLDDPRRRGGPLEEPERDRREGSRRHGRNWGGPDFERVRCGLEQERQGRRAGLGGAGDMTLSMTGRERSEYLRWKQERERIDQERLQRHRKPTGQWRREWDAEKTDGMFKDGSTHVHEPFNEPSPRYDEQAWARPPKPPKPPTFGEFLSQHKAEVSSRRKRKSSRPQAKAAPRAYSNHDDRWEMKEETASPAPEVPQPAPPEEPPLQTPEPPAPAHRPPEDEGEEDEGEDVDGEDIDGEEDEEWEDVSEDVSEDEEDEEGEDAIEEEEEEGPAQDHQHPGAEPTGHPTSEQADDETPSQPEEPSPLPQASAAPSSPFSPPSGHQPVSDWGEEMELNSPRTAHPADALSPGGDQPVPAPLESGPSLPGTQKAEEEGSEATAEAGPEGQETAEITDFQRASLNS